MSSVPGGGSLRELLCGWPVWTVQGRGNNPGFLSFLGDEGQL